MKKVVLLLTLLVPAAYLTADRLPTVSRYNYHKNRRYRSPGSYRREENKRKKEQTKVRARDTQSVMGSEYWNCRNDITKNTNDILRLKTTISGLERQIMELQKQNAKIVRQVLYLKKIIKKAGLTENVKSSKGEPNEIVATPAIDSNSN